MTDDVVEGKRGRKTLEGLGEDHLADADHAAPAGVALHTVDSFSVGEPDGVAEIQIELVFVFAVVLVNFPKEGYGLVFI